MTINRMNINLGMENSAFEDDKWEEVARILKRIADRISKDDLPYLLIDSNGNSVGTISYDGEEG